MLHILAYVLLCATTVVDLPKWTEVEGHSEHGSDGGSGGELAGVHVP